MPGIKKTTVGSGTEIDFLVKHMAFKLETRYQVMLGFVRKKVRI